MLETSHLLLKIAAGLYGLSLCYALARKNGSAAARIVLFFPALALNAAAVFIRYRQAWPMLPMYLGPAALPLSIGLVTLCLERKNREGSLSAILMALMFFTALGAVLFPRDFYLPFIRSQSAPAHLFFVFGVAGRACFLISASIALNGLIFRPKSAENVRIFRWAALGFGFWTLSMFSGELWSYLGWGTPVVWDDPAITTVMAAWFYYAALLHLHLAGSFSARTRSACAAFGVVVVLGLTCLPDWGPFRWPF